MIHYISAERLTIARVEEILTKGYKLALSDDAKARINKCREYLDKKMEDAGAVFFPCAGLAVNIPDSISIESEEPCYTKSIFGVVAQIPEIFKDSIETDKEEEWLYLDILFSPYTRRHFYRQINAENPSNIGYYGMGAGEYWISDKRSRDTTSFPIIHFYVENNEGRGTIESLTRYDGCDLLPVRLVKDAE